MSRSRKAWPRARAAPTASCSSWCASTWATRVRTRPAIPMRTTAMSEPSALHDPVKIGIVSISDRASSGVYEDKGLPALQDWLTRALHNPITFESRLIPDEHDCMRIVPGFFASVPYCVDLIGGPYLETRDEVCKAFRPKNAVRAPRPA